MLGVLVGINATLRLIPGPLGFSAVFFLPILCGYGFGADFGFLMGALSLLVSGIITGAMGPWLPFQMFAAGWVGLVGGWLPHFHRQPRGEVLLLAGWGMLSGFLYGVIMNLWFWPYLAAPVEQAASGESTMFWETHIGFWSTLTRYILFYLTTSLWWDAGRAIGNLLLILLVGVPILKLLYRFEQRFRFSRT
jgi:energy-coupling factor transport system substrate-specific component